MYWAMFSCSASMNFHPSASPHICSHAVTSRKPVPLEAGCGITILPLYTGLVRSFQVTGFGRFCLAASTVLKQIVAPHVHPEPHRRVARVAVLRADRRQVGRGVRLQHAVEIQHHEAGRGKSHHDVGLWIGLLGHQLGRDDPGRVAYPFELDIRIEPC